MITISLPSKAFTGPTKEIKPLYLTKVDDVKLFQTPLFQVYNKEEVKIEALVARHGNDRYIGFRFTVCEVFPLFQITIKDTLGGDIVKKSVALPTHSRSYSVPKWTSSIDSQTDITTYTVDLTLKLDRRDFIALTTGPEVIRLKLTGFKDNFILEKLGLVLGLFKLS